VRSSFRWSLSIFTLFLFLSLIQPKRNPNCCRLLQTTQAFKELTSLSNLCGVIDTTRVHLRFNPNPNLNPYRCCYDYPSLLLQVVSDHKKIFWDVCVKAPSGTDDATHFRDNLLYHRLTSDDVV